MSSLASTTSADRHDAARYADAERSYGDLLGRRARVCCSSPLMYTATKTLSEARRGAREQHLPRLRYSFCAQCWIGVRRIENLRREETSQKSCGTNRGPVLFNKRVRTYLILHAAGLFGSMDAFLISRVNRPCQSSSSSSGALPRCAVVATAP